MYEEVVAGLSSFPRTLPSKYFYDETGSRLFDQITRLDEYYLTRAETEIMEAHAADMARAIGPGALLVEFGSGSSVKTGILLDHLEGPAGYVPIDISGDYLHMVAARLRRRYPALPILPLEADFTRPLALQQPPIPPRRRVVYFPGSTIGNFSGLEAVRLLGRMRTLAGKGGAVLIGFDLLKSRERLHAAYNDPAGVTARFNLNLLEHVNRVLGADFDPGGFEHRAPFNEEASRIEMHLVSRRAQTVQVGPHRFHFEPGDMIVTEHSHKYAPDAFAALAATAGLRAVAEWTDAEGLFCVQLLEAEG
jgi:dimethylhistidine N-methyltransferase